MIDFCKKSTFKNGFINNGHSYSYWCSNNCSDLEECDECAYLCINCGYNKESKIFVNEQILKMVQTKYIIEE